MRTSLFIIIVILSVNVCLGSCFGPKYSLTEILANEEDAHHVFTCTVIATYWGDGGYTSLALVNKIYRGNPLDSVYIVTGGLTTEGGTMIILGTEWLIISETKDRKHYTATICHNLSRRIDDKKIQCSQFTNKEGKGFLKVIEQYFILVNSRYTGSTILSAGSEVFAKANFIQGKADGSWEHYKYSHELEKQVLVSEFDYKGGIINGKIIKYRDDIEPKMKIYEGLIFEGLIRWEIFEGKKMHSFVYLGDSIKAEYIVILGEEGDTLRIEKRKYLDYHNDQLFKIWYRDDYYFNMKDSSDLYPLCEGNYFKGAKVGLWNFFNQKGEIISVEVFPYPDTLGAINRIYDDKGLVAYEGYLVEGLRVGKWSQFYKGVLENEIYYDTDTDPNLIVRHYRSGERLLSPYTDGQIHGTQIELDVNGKVKSLCEFEDGNKSGRYIVFDANGKVEKESKYIFNRETTIFDISKNAPKVNGFSNGYNIQYNLSDGHKMYEGKIDMGYNVGKHIYYKKDGSYTITYNSENIEHFMNPCKYNNPLMKEYYDKNGKLITTENQDGF